MLDRVQEGYMTSGRREQPRHIWQQGHEGNIDLILAFVDVKDKLLYDLVPALWFNPQVTKALQ
eukprot:2995560-Lingulodinium_polyedra.AAC.1